MDQRPEGSSSFFYVRLLILSCVGLAGACGKPNAAVLAPTHTPRSAPSESPTVIFESTATMLALITPISEYPAAGICAGPAEGEITDVVIYPDIPDPRCLRISANQTLQVTNQTDRRLEIDLGPFHANIQPGETYLFLTPFGEFLSPGVHSLLASPYGGPQLWLE
jgi:hypothetical protein